MQYSERICCIVNNQIRPQSRNETRTLLVGWVSLAWSPRGLDISFVVKGAGAVMLLFRFECKTSYMS